MDWFILSYFLLFLISVFSVLAMGAFANQSQTLDILTKTFNQWAKHLKESPSSESPSAMAPFEELGPMQSAVESLHLEIKRLNHVAAKDAKAKTQLSMLREISHDLKTPVSQLSKFFSVLVSKTRRTGTIDQELVDQVQRSMGRVGDLIRQVEAVGPNLKSAVANFNGTDISSETQRFIDDFKKTSTFIESGLLIKLDASPTKLAAVPGPQFYRILDNLVRNSCDAVDPKTGVIEVCIAEIEDRPTLIVRDNGTGISNENLYRIFDAEFTTKPARGTGLGLSIVKKLCDDLLAEIKVISTLGVGAEFQVRFQPTRISASIQTSSSQEVTL